jgi:calcineurin-like phosphoesterase
MGVHVITTGNHVWDKKEFVNYISKDNRVLRPLNYPPGVPGYGSVIYTLSDGMKVGIINLSGRVFMPSMDCPFRTVRPEIDTCERRPIIIVDLHAEATSEKMPSLFCRRQKAVLGTHTHADCG